MLHKKSKEISLLLLLVVSFLPPQSHPPPLYFFTLAVTLAVPLCEWNRNVGMCVVRTASFEMLLKLRKVVITHQFTSHHALYRKLWGKFACINIIPDVYVPQSQSIVHFILHLQCHSFFLKFPLGPAVCVKFSCPDAANFGEVNQEGITWPGKYLLKYFSTDFPDRNTSSNHLQHLHHRWSIS